MSGLNRKRRLKKYSKFAVTCFLFLLVFTIGFLRGLDREEEKKESTQIEKVKEIIKNEIYDTHIPILSFVNRTDRESKLKTSVLGFSLKQFPINQYLLENMEYEVSIEDETTYELIRKSEGNDENQIDKKGNLIVSEGDIGVEQTLTNQNETTVSENTQEPKVPESSSQNAVNSVGIEFVKAVQKSKSYQLEQYHSFEELRKEFYAVDKTTMIDAKQLNIQKLMGKDMKLKTEPDKPQILIYHTHSQETFSDSIPGEEAGSVVGAGETLATILREEYHYNVIHDKGHYDVKSRDYAYSEAAPALERLLAENPSIEVVIDLHRDGVGDDKKLVTTLNGRPTAQFMFFNGLSRTKSRGEIDYLNNPYVDDNLSFAFQMQLKCNEYYPGVTRKIYLKGYRYNMHYRAKSLLIELGAQTNTVEEIKNACDPIAHVLHMVLSGEEPEAY